MAKRPVPPSATVKSALTNAILALKAAAIETPRLDAEVLLAHLLRQSRAWLYAHPEYALAPQTARRYQTLLEQRLRHTPVAYLTGEREFFGLPFFVSPAVLIPRPETELLVELALKRIRAGDTVIDVGTGSGCLAVSLAVNSAARIIATDISTAALSIAQKNISRHNVGNQVKLLCANLLTGLSGPVNIIVSNPPYISPATLPTLPATVRQFEPRRALTDGVDGLSAIAGLLRVAPRILKAGGHLLIETGASQGDAALELAQTHCPRAGFEIRRDLAGKDRVLVGRF